MSTPTKQMKRVLVGGVAVRNHVLSEGTEGGGEEEEELQLKYM